MWHVGSVPFCRHSIYTHIYPGCLEAKLCQMPHDVAVGFERGRVLMLCRQHPSNTVYIHILDPLADRVREHDKGEGEERARPDAPGSRAACDPYHLMHACMSVARPERVGGRTHRSRSRSQQVVATRAGTGAAERARTKSSWGVRDWICLRISVGAVRERAGGRV